MALDMLKRLGSPERIVEVLLAKDQVHATECIVSNVPKPIPALTYVRSQKGRQVKIELHQFLEVALKSDDPTIFYTIFQFFHTRYTGPDEQNVLQEYVKYFPEKKVEEETEKVDNDVVTNFRK